METKSGLVRAFGFPATLVHGDTLVLDRWLWLKRHLDRVAPGSKSLLDVGCGTGAFTIGAARRGYRSLGLSWDTRNQRVAQDRAKMCNAPLAQFDVQDVRRLDERSDLAGQFDVAICCECIEHILDDGKLMRDIARCLKPGGTVLLTSPNLVFKPMAFDNEVLTTVENGGHVRRGYSSENLQSLCESSGFEPVEIDFCSGFLSQKLTSAKRIAGHWSADVVGWAVVLPFRWIPPILDGAVSRYSGWPDYSITLVARKRG